MESGLRFVYEEYIEKIVNYEKRDIIVLSR